MRPHQCLELRDQTLGVVIVNLRLDVHRPHPVLEQCLDAGRGVTHLAFGVEDDAAGVGKVGRRAIQAEQVGEVRYRDAKVGARLIAPDRGEIAAVPANHLDRKQEFRGVEASGVDDHVDVVVARGADDARGIDARHALIDQLHIRLLQRAQPAAVVLQHALAHEGKLRGDFLQQLDIAIHLALHVLDEL